MPVTMWCFVFLSLALTGIPPTGGFISKWYLILGALHSETGIFSWLGPVVLLVSALLTAGYLLPIAMKGFFPGEDYKYEKNAENRRKKLSAEEIPIVVLTVLAVGLGIWPNPLIKYILGIVSFVLQEGVGI